MLIPARHAHQEDYTIVHVDIFCSQAARELKKKVELVRPLNCVILFSACISQTRFSWIHFVVVAINVTIKCDSKNARAETISRSDAKCSSVEISL